MTLIPDDTPFLEAVYDALASSQNLPSAEDQTEQATPELTTEDQAGQTAPLPARENQEGQGSAAALHFEEMLAFYLGNHRFLG